VTTLTIRPARSDNSIYLAQSTFGLAMVVFALFSFVGVEFEKSIHLQKWY
jgi:hypothetical protein